MKSNRAPMLDPLVNPAPPQLGVRDARLWQIAWRSGYAAAERRLLGVPSRRQRVGGWIPRAAAVLLMLTGLGLIARGLT